MCSLNNLWTWGHIYPETLIVTVHERNRGFTNIVTWGLRTDLLHNTISDGNNPNLDNLTLRSGVEDRKKQGDYELVRYLRHTVHLTEVDQISCLTASIRNSQINSKNAMKSVNFNLLVNSAPALADSLPSVSSPPTPVTAVTTPVTRDQSEGNHLYSLCSQFWLKESHPVRRNTSSSQNSAETWNWSQVRLRHLLPNFHSSLNTWLLVFHLQSSDQ